MHSLNYHYSVIPAKAGIPFRGAVWEMQWDSRLRGGPAIRNDSANA